MAPGRFFFPLLAAPLLVAAGGGSPGFDRCGSGPRVTCVVDGDTLWLEGTKIRLADINAPETSHPRCPGERALGQRATARLIALLNTGPVAFERSAAERDADRYGRKLRVALRGGESLGDVLVGEGLAERWNGRRKDWCGAAS